MENKTVQLKKRQKLMLEALHKHRGLISHASAACGVGRNTYYDWMRDDPDFVKEVDAIHDYVLDKVEETAMSMVVEDRNPAMTIFYLKCKGKKRGYVERQEIEHSISDNLKESVALLLDEHENDY